MRYALKAVLPVLLALATAGCGDFLSGADEDPNNPANVVRPGPIYIGIQTLQSVQFEGQLARSAAEYVQQVAGISRQQLGFDLYQMDPTTIDPQWYSVYGSSRTVTGGGGLLDIRKMQERARAVNDTIYLGIAKVYEALVMGMAASIWGDIPYREAADSTNLTPAFDPQLQVYADVQAQLDSAIDFLSVAPSAFNVGPPSDGSELVYNDRGGNTQALADVYKEVAHTLKARYFMHLAEVNPDNYDSALVYVVNGISSTANNMLWFHDQSPAGTNVWWQFYAARGDIGPGAAMIEVMKRRITAGLEDAARLNFFFTPADPPGAPANFFGYRPGASTDMQATPPTYNGNGSASGAYSDFNFMNFTLDPGDVRIPVVTFAETELIWAEAAFANGAVGTAGTHLNTARANRSYGARGNAPIVFPALGGTTATLQNIMEEKYLALFLNIEAWNDYKRTCFPRLAPAPPSLGSTTTGTQPIPGRLPYGLSDINANPNTPNVPATGFNANDPAPCPVLNYTTGVTGVTRGN